MANGEVGTAGEEIADGALMRSGSQRPGEQDKEEESGSHRRHSEGRRGGMERCWPAAALTRRGYRRGVRRWSGCFQYR